MYSFTSMVAFCIAPLVMLTWSTAITTIQVNEEVHFYENFLKEIYHERAYDTLVVILDGYAEDARLADIYSFSHPKIFLSKNLEFVYKLEKYNSEILAIILMENALNVELMEIAARSLYYIRQSRVLIIAQNIRDKEDYMDTCLNLLQEYPMTNVLLHFMESSQEIPLDYQQLKPYPKFHWQVKSLRETKLVYYPQHWRNLHGVNITTHTDQNIPGTIAYKDEQGNWKLNGHVARLVLLFVEHFNGTVRMYKTLNESDVGHFTIVADMATKRLIDIAMCLHVISTPGHSTWIYASDVYEIGQGMLIVPCAQPLNTRDMFRILLNEYFFGTVVICSVLFSFLHFLIDYYFDGDLNYLNLLFNNRIIGGVLGLSFSGRRSPWRGLKLIYILLFIAGLNINTQFSANMNTLFTSPPHYRQIETLADIRESPLKINILKADLSVMGGIMLDIFRSLVITENITEYRRMRFDFNTTTGYYTPMYLWKLFNFKQKYHRYKSFCTYDNLTVHRFIPWNVLLQPNSQYKDAFNYLLHRVHQAGMLDAWYASAFYDLVKLKRLSLVDPNPERGPQAMTVDDLQIAWLVIVIGLVVSGAIFFLELWYYHNFRYRD
ncbi:uncharacterized protein [Musca autumnalis]|uniref:uncharacterized protein n=1 Tax=Musca autumnalis TaxID=221902 RepID=UPI003CF54598